MRQPTLPAAGRRERQRAAEVLDALVDARLLTSYEPPAIDPDDTGHRRIEIVHESLLTSWPRLVRWHTQDQDGAQLRDQLRQAARLWDERGRPEDLLWTGTSFREYELWRERYAGSLSASEDTFTRAMTSRTLRRRRQRRLAGAALTAAALVVAVAMGVLWRQSENARLQAVASTRRAEAQQLFTLGQAEIDGNPTAAVAYALASLEHDDSPHARRLALRALWRGPTAFILSRTDPSWSNHQLSFSNDGDWLAGVSDRDRNRAPLEERRFGATRDSRHRRPRPFRLGRFCRRRPLVRGHDVGRDPDVLASRNDRDPAYCGDLPLGIRPWPVRHYWRVCRANVRWTGEAPDQVVPAARRCARNHAGDLDVAAGRGWSVRRRSDGAVAVGRPRRFALRGPPFRTRSAQPRLVVRGGDDPIVSFTLSSDGTSIYAMHPSGAWRVWSRATGTNSRALPVAVRRDQLFGGVISADGRWLAASWSQAVDVWNLAASAAGEPLVLRSGGRPGSVAIDPTGSWLAAQYTQTVSLVALDDAPSSTSCEDPRRAFALS